MADFIHQMVEVPQITLKRYEIPQRAAYILSKSLSKGILVNVQLAFQDSRSKQ